MQSFKSKRSSHNIDKRLDFATCIIVLDPEKVKCISFFAIFSINQRVSITTTQKRSFNSIYLPLIFCIVTHIAANFQNHLLFSFVLTKSNKNLDAFYQTAIFSVAN